MAIYTADLHVHTILSPCAEVEMIPPLIVSRAMEVGLDIIGITDHNSAENVEAVIQAAKGTSLKVFPGMECETVEGVHVICLFDETEQTMQMQEVIYASLPPLPNRPETFGAQFVVDATGEFIRYNELLLLVPTELSIEAIVETVERIGGLVMPAHVDRMSYGIYGVLGFLPKETEFKGVEISNRITPDQAVKKFPDLKGRKLFNSSDAHRLEEIGSGRTMLELAHRTVADIKLGLAD